mgnify:CR=1 FL=1
MTRDMTCIICPRGCALKVEINGDNITVTGNGCPKGKQYPIDECTNPTRTVTSSVRVVKYKVSADSDFSVGVRAEPVIICFYIFIFSSLCTA